MKVLTIKQSKKKTDQEKEHTATKKRTLVCKTETRYLDQTHYTDQN